MKVKNKFFNCFTYAILVVFLCTTNFAYAINKPHLSAMKTIAVKFSLAMLGVVLFSIIMWLGLSFYNRYFVAKQIKDFKMSQDSLRTPLDNDEAVKMFITKNRLR